MELVKKKNKKAGRPVKTQRKEVRAAVRFTLADYKSIEERATKAGMKVSAFIRDAALHATIISRLTEQELLYIRQLVGMSTNLNQVAKTCHREGLYEAMLYFESYRNQLDALLQKLKP